MVFCRCKNATPIATKRRPKFHSSLQSAASVDMEFCRYEKLIDQFREKYPEMFEGCRLSKVGVYWFWLKSNIRGKNNSRKRYSIFPIKRLKYRFFKMLCAILAHIFKFSRQKQNYPYFLNKDT